VPYYADAIHLHFEVPPLKMNPTERNKVVDPLEVVGTETVLFSVFTHEIV
jgi:hypothetical protein